MRLICAVMSCRKTSSSNPNLKFIEVPSEPELCREWLNLIGHHERTSQRKRKMYVCESHFNPQDINGEVISKTNVLPCLKLPAPRNLLQPSQIIELPVFRTSSNLTANKGTQYVTPWSIPGEEVNEKKATMRQQRIERLEEFEKLCDTFLQKDLSDLVKLQAAFKTQFRKDKYSNEFKFFCLKFYHKNPENYLALQKYYNLPNVKGLLQNCLSSAAQDRRPLFAALYPKIEGMTDLEKNCSVLVSEVELKPHLYYNVGEDKIYGFSNRKGDGDPQIARRAVVVMARGLYEQWVLPIDYGLFHRKDNTIISKWVASVLEKLIYAGLKIRACVSNMSSNELIADQHTLCVEKPFYSEARSIYHVYDPTYLVIQVLNYLVDHEIRFESSVAKWQDIVNFYKSDSKKQLRLAPELTKKHVKPKGGKIDAGLAKDMLSARVAAGISAHIDFGQMDESAKGTVKFLTMMSRLYKFMNSSKAKNNCEYQKPLCGSDFQSKFVIDALSFFRGVKLFRNGVDITQNVNIFKEIQIAIRAEVLLYEDLLMEDLPNLCTKNIRLDILEKFLQRIRERSKMRDITAWRLIAAHRKMLYRNVMKTGKQKKCPQAVSDMFEEYFKKKLVSSAAYERLSGGKFQVAELNLFVKKSEYEDFKLPAEHQLIFVSKYLMEKCWKKHAICSIPQVKPIFHEELFSLSSAVFEIDADLNAKYPRITIPSNSLIHFIQLLENNIRLQFAEGLVNKQPLLETLSANAEHLISAFEQPCKCFPTTYLIKLFYRLRLSEILKESNRSFKNYASDQDLQFKFIKLE